MFRRGFGLVAGLLWSAVALGQPGMAPPPPPGFNFDPPKAVPAAPPPPVLTEVSGGLFPPEKVVKVWSGGGEVGLNGAEGNSKLLNLRAGLNAQRKTAENLFKTDLLYTYAEQNTLLTQSQVLFNARDEILFPGTAWSLFAATNLEHDQLRAYRFRIGVYGGVGYQVIDTAQTNWRVRGGAGAVREIAGYAGGPDSRWVAEMVFGTDYNYKFDDRQSFDLTVDYYPRVNNFAQYRVRARAAYQILLDRANCVTLRLGVQDRYDSDPGGAQRNDLNYFATIGFIF